MTHVNDKLRDGCDWFAGNLVAEISRLYYRSGAVLTMKRALMGSGLREGGCVWGNGTGMM